MKNHLWRNILIVLVVLIGLAALARFVVFKDEFDKVGEGLVKVKNREENYRASHPNATDEEVDAAFDQSMESIRQWKETYVKTHPGATDADADAAFEAAWESVNN